MAATEALVGAAAKRAAVYVVENIDKLLPVIIALILLQLYFPVMFMTIFLPSSNDDMQSRYKEAAKNSGMDWIEIMAYDTVYYDNSMNDVKPEESALNFISIDYSEFEKKEVTTSSYVTKTAGGVLLYKVTVDEKESFLSYSAVSVLQGLGKKVSFVYQSSTSLQWELKQSGTATGYSAISMFLASAGYNVSLANMYVTKISSYCEELDKKEEYDVKFNKLTLLDMASNLDDNKKEWLFDILTSLYDKNDNFNSGTVREYINPDGAYMSNLKLSSSSYPQGDLLRLSGDVDIDKVFAGRIAALADAVGKDVVITSGYRSIAEQQAIWDATPVERRGKYVAKPGNSRHQYGLAADIKGWLLYVSNDTLIKYGLYKPMSYEKWHIEPVESRR